MSSPSRMSTLYRVCFITSTLNIIQPDLTAARSVPPADVLTIVSNTTTLIYTNVSLFCLQSFISLFLVKHTLRLTEYFNRHMKSSTLRQLDIAGTSSPVLKATSRSDGNAKNSTASELKPEKIWRS